MYLYLNGCDRTDTGSAVVPAVPGERRKERREIFRDFFPGDPAFAADGSLPAADLKSVLNSGIWDFPGTDGILFPGPGKSGNGQPHSIISDLYRPCGPCHRRADFQRTDPEDPGGSLSLLGRKYPSGFIFWDHSWKPGTGRVRFSGGNGPGVSGEKKRNSGRRHPLPFRRKSFRRFAGAFIGEREL